MARVYRPQPDQRSLQIHLQSSLVPTRPPGHRSVTNTTTCRIVAAVGKDEGRRAFCCSIVQAQFERLRGDTKLEVLPCGPVLRSNFGSRLLNGIQVCSRHHGSRGGSCRISPDISHHQIGIGHPGSLIEYRKRCIKRFCRFIFRAGSFPGQENRHRSPGHVSLVTAPNWSTRFAAARRCVSVTSI